MLLQSIDLAVAAEQLGADGAYFRVHHFAQQLASPFPLLAAVGAKTKTKANDTLAMMERTVEIEAIKGGNPTILDLFKGTDLRRTIITCLIYASQNFAGNLIANQATFFFERKSTLK